MEDQAVHFFDLIRFITQKDIVQVKADVFIPNSSTWQGSSTTLANLGIAAPEDYNHRREWVWGEYYSDWQRMGPPDFLWEFSGKSGRFVIDGNWGLKTWLYTNEDGSKWEEDGYMIDNDVANMGTNYDGQMVILEQMKRSIDSKGKEQPMTNFKEAFKSFAVTMGCLESSRTGKSVWIPKYWEDLALD